MTKLRKCPFCGGDAVVMHMDYGKDCLPEVQTVWGVWCRNDMEDEYAHGHCVENYATEEDAIKAWNGLTAKPYVNHGDHGPEPRFKGDAWTMWYCCSNCKHPVSRADRFCHTCGATLDWSS